MVKKRKAIGREESQKEGSLSIYRMQAAVRLTILPWEPHYGEEQRDAYLSLERTFWSEKDH